MDLIGLGPKPVAGVRVRAKSEGRVYKTLSNAEGLYEFHNLPPGNYPVTPSLPPATARTWKLSSYKPTEPVAITAGSCMEHEIDVASSASIQGRILDASGKPLPKAVVFIIPSDQKVLPKEKWTSGAWQEKEGFFKFTNLRPGKYLILVNPDDALNPDFPYRRTYYPGVSDRAAARIITILGSEQIKDADIRLEPPTATRRLNLRVAWIDGRPVKHRIQIEAIGTDNLKANSHAKRPASEGDPIELTLLYNEPYRITATLTCWYRSSES